jgi:hypothetical protein
MRRKFALRTAGSAGRSGASPGAKLSHGRRRPATPEACLPDAGLARPAAYHLERRPRRLEYTSFGRADFIPALSNCSR